MHVFYVVFCVVYYLLYLNYKHVFVWSFKKNICITYSVLKNGYDVIHVSIITYYVLTLSTLQSLYRISPILS